MRLEAWHLAAFIFPALVLLHLYLSPYTKVEESFNVQATHDILTYGIPTENAHLRFKAKYDHMKFPGAVPRTFVGALFLSGIAKPAISNLQLSLPDQQFLVRAILGLLNAAALSYYAYGVRRAYGRSTALWFTLLQASQFHVFYYASRPLPNMYAFALSTFAMRFLLPDPTSSWSSSKRTRLALYIFTLTTIVFRAEFALLLFSYCMTFVVSAIYYSASIPTLLRATALPAILAGGFAGLTLTIPIDTYFWRQSITPSTLLWPELSAFLFNIFPSATSGTNHLGASAWGTSPFHWYFTSAIPRLLINPFLLLPLIFSLTPYFPHLQFTAALLSPILPFTLLYSLLSHKETRFIFPIIPPLTTALALGAAYITTHRSRSTLYTLITYILLISTLATTFLSHAILLPLSALTYPGGMALTSLHALSAIYPPQRDINVHLCNLALQTGVTRFLQNPPPKSPLVILPGSADGRYPEIRSGATKWMYDKSDNDTGVYNEEGFWRQFDYVIVEDKDHALPVRGGWDVVDTIYGLGRPRVVGGEVGRGMLVLGDSEEGRRGADGIMGVLETMYGERVLGRMVVRGYGVLHDVLREGWGLPGRRSLTGGRWLHWGMERRLFIMRRSENMSRREWNP